MDDQEKIDLILAWAEDHPRFDISFVEDLNAKLSEFESLTGAQSVALDNIIERFRIDR